MASDPSNGYAAGIDDDGDDDTALPIFDIQKVQLRFDISADFVAAQVANNVLVLALSTGRILRFDLDNPSDIDDIDLPKRPAEIGVIRRLFLDPSASHLLVSTTLGENYYLHTQSRQPKPLGRLKGVQLDSVAWSPSQPTASTREILLGAADGAVYETTFILFVTFAGISIRFRYLLPTGVSPTTHKPNFLEWVPPRYLARMRRFVIHIDHVDQYTGQIKFNVGGKGLVHGLQRQVQRLVDALSPSSSSSPPYGDDRAQISHLTLRVSNGSAVSDSIKTELERRRVSPPRIAQDLETMLSPFLQLSRIREVSVGGAITPEFAAQLEKRMHGGMRRRDAGRSATRTHLYVYSDDLTIYEGMVKL
nr:vacuolar membrane protein pep3 [Quercus suber]